MNILPRIYIFYYFGNEITKKNCNVSNSKRSKIFIAKILNLGAQYLLKEYRNLSYIKIISK